MTISDLLERHKNSIIFIRESSYTYGHFASLLESPGPERQSFHWNGEWSYENFVSLLQALKNESPIHCSVVHEAFPPINRGEISFKTSGTEGEAKWIIHPYRHFLEGETLPVEGPAVGLLFPAHAAGFDFLFHCLRRGLDFGFADLRGIEKLTPKTIFGPPQALAALLFFSTRYQSILENLRNFYVSADVISSAIVDKVRQSSFSFRIKQFYGSSETMVIGVEENSEKPWLLKFRPSEAEVRGDRIYYTGKTLALGSWTSSGGFSAFKLPFPLGDVVTPDGEWLHLRDNKRNSVKIWGHRINLKRVEDEILKLETVIDVLVESISSDLMGNTLTIHIWSELPPELNQVIKAVPELLPISTAFSIRHHSPDTLQMSKKKRISGGKTS